jgi:hypothetical protein
MSPFLVANYETAQPPELAYDSTPYVWAVETIYHGPTDTRAARITAALAGRPRNKRHSHTYFHGWSVGVNHTEAALEYMRGTILSSGSSAELVGMFSTSTGFLFIFR